MADKITGGCLCGSVRYEVENTFSKFYFCHCQQCQKITGSAHASNLFTHPESMQWTHGEKLTKNSNIPIEILP